MTLEEVAAGAEAKKQPIRAIYGPEPLREGEYPTTYIVGSNAYDARLGPVERITYREEFYGDHGLGWFDVFTAEGRIASMSARQVAEVHYRLTVPA